jgi:hypothetical protein
MPAETVVVEVEGMSGGGEREREGMTHILGPVALDTAERGRRARGEVCEAVVGRGLPGRCLGVDLLDLHKGKRGGGSNTPADMV